MTPSESNTAVAPDILEEIRQIKQQNLEILRLLRVAGDRRWYNLQDAGERLGRAAWTLRQLCHGKIRAEKGEDILPTYAPGTVPSPFHPWPVGDIPRCGVRH
jgi:hypothetical protein